MREKLAFEIMYVFIFSISTLAYAEVPRYGVRIDSLSDNFEDPNWTFNYSGSGGTSSNGMWYGSFRGAPEILNRVAPPSGGIVTSTGALQIRSYDNYDDAYATQEDLVSVFHETRSFGRRLTAADLPSITARFYMPDISTWTFNDHYTIGLRTEIYDADLALNGGTYYPSVWFKKDPWGASYQTQVVARTPIGDIVMGTIDHTVPAWYTIGMSWDENGVVSYYASTGVDDLTENDRLYTDIASGATMDTINYHFLSLGYPAGPDISADVIVDDISVYMIPEPITLGLLAIGGLAMLRRKKKIQVLVTQFKR